MQTAELPKPNIKLPIVGARGLRVPQEKLDRLAAISTATASATFFKMGVELTSIKGPKTTIPGRKLVGQAVTLQFMPMREDLASRIAQEEYERDSALWYVLDEIQQGDILVIAAKGDPDTGCLGEMLLTYLKGRGGIGAIVHGCIRDWPKIKELDIPIWTNGFTPNYATQAGLLPWGYNVPIDMSGVLVLPGDVILADDDGVVCVPENLVDTLLERAGSHEEWEEFSRERLAEGGSIWRYYPLSREGRAEYDDWKSRKAGS